MLRPRAFHPKETKSLKSREEAMSPAEAFATSRPEESNYCPQPSGRSPELLAPDDMQGIDSEAWGVIDDWPEIVPITSDEVEVIEAFLRKALNDLLK